MTDKNTPAAGQDPERPDEAADATQDNAARPEQADSAQDASPRADAPQGEPTQDAPQAESTQADSQQAQSPEDQSPEAQSPADNIETPEEVKEELEAEHDMVAEGGPAPTTGAPLTSAEQAAAEQAAAEGNTAPAAPAAATVPAAPATRVRTDRNRSSRNRRYMWIGIAAIAVILAVVAAITVPRLVGDLGTGSSEVQSADITSEPEIGSWELDAPEGIPEGGTASVVGGYTTAQDTALVIWTVSAEEAASTYWISLVDTSNGKQKWSTPIEGDFTGVAAVSNPLGQEFALLAAQGVDGDTFGAISLDSGEYTSGPALDVLAQPEVLEGHFIAYDGAEQTVGRYSPSDLKASWTVDAAEITSAPTVAGSSLLLGDKLVDLATGEDRSWSLTQGNGYGQIGGALMTSRPKDGGYELAALNEEDGEDLWSLPLVPGSSLSDIPDTGMFAVSDPQANTVKVINVSDGSTVWSVDSALTADAPVLQADVAAGVIFLPVSEDPDTLTVFDLKSGDKRGDISTAAVGEVPVSISGASKNTVYVTGGSPASIRGLNADDGSERWSLQSTDEKTYKFSVWGGNPIAIGPGEDQANGETALLGIR